MLGEPAGGRWKKPRQQSMLPASKTLNKNPSGQTACYETGAYRAKTTAKNQVFFCFLLLNCFGVLLPVLIITNWLINVSGLFAMFFGWFGELPKTSPNLAAWTPSYHKNTLKRPRNMGTSVWKVCVLCLCTVWGERISETPFSTLGKTATEKWWRFLSNNLQTLGYGINIFQKT